MDAELGHLVGDMAVSEALNAYFRALGEWDGAKEDLGLLPETVAVERTQEFRTFHPVVRSLRGVILDDPGTSDHHIVLCRDGVKGTVLYLAHDGTSRIVFSSIGDFLKAAHHAADAGGFVDDGHPDHACVLDGQGMLRSLIVSLRSEPDYGDVVLPLVPSLELSDLDFMSMLVRDDDVYVAEAVCREIAARPAASLMVVAGLGETHPHWMVRNAAALARERIASFQVN